jgi:hypothetical protein
MAAFYLIGAALTAVLYPVLFAKRYRGQPRWIAIGVVLGLVAALVWPLTLWVAVAMSLTGFTRPPAGVRRRRRVVFPLAACGSLATFVIMGLIAGPAPAAAPGTGVAVADVVAPTTSAPPSTTTAPTTPPPGATAAVVATPKPSATRPPTTSTRRPVVTTTRAPEPEPRPAPDPDPEPERDRDDDDSGTKPRSGNSGHPCTPGERDGDGDGYCGER